MGPKLFSLRREGCLQQGGHSWTFLPQCLPQPALAMASWHVEQGMSMLARPRLLTFQT